MKPCRENCMGRGVLSQQRVGVSVKPEGFGRNGVAQSGILSISMAEYPNIVTILLEHRVDALPAICKLLESITAANASASNPFWRMAR